MAWHSYLIVVVSKHITRYARCHSRSFEKTDVLSHSSFYVFTFNYKIVTLVNIYCLESHELCLNKCYVCCQGFR